MNNLTPMKNCPGVQINPILYALVLCIIEFIKRVKPNLKDVINYMYRRVAEIQIFEKNLPHRHKG